MEDFDSVPRDRDAEEAVLACCYQSATATERAAATITGRDFYWPEHEEIFAAMARMRRDRQPVDHVTLGNVLRTLPSVQAEAALRLLPALVTSTLVPEQVARYAEIVRDCAIRRRVIDTATTYRQRAYSPDTNPRGLLEEFTRDMRVVAESTADDVDTRLLSEILDTEEAPYDWIVPGLLERGDRLVLTGFEGLGKSTFLRQIGVLPAAGLHPFKPKSLGRSIRTHYFEFENSETHVRRHIRGLVAAARNLGEDPTSNVAFDFRPRVNLLRDRDLSWLHRSLDATQPDLVVMGPIYKMFNKAINSDEDAAEVLEVLDGIRARGVALVIEAHSGHTRGPNGKRDLRPRGASALMGWPEFGYGLQPHHDADARRQGAVELTSWRGDRDERSWPRELGRGGKYPWTDLNYNPNLEAVA